METNNKIERVVYELFKTEPFFANFLLACNIVYDDPKVTRAACSIQRGDIYYYFNSDYFFALTLTQQIAVLKHETMHILLDHCGGRTKSHINHAAKNVAMDCAINQNIAGLPDDCVTLESMEKMVGKSLAKNECWEYYYEMMKDKAKENSKGKGTGEPHDHDKMEEGDGTITIESEEAGAEYRRAVVKDKLNKAVAASAGNVSNSIQEILNKLNKPSQVPWKQKLRNLVASARATTTKSTWQKSHRRFDLDAPGRKKDRKLVIGVCADSSGSVSDAAYSAFMNEIANIAKQTTITYVIHADCEVQKVDIIKNGKPADRVLSQRHGNGGTAYQPAIDKAVSLGCDAIIYFGDFDCADTPKNPGKPFIWVGVGSQVAPGNFGQVLRIIE